MDYARINSEVIDRWVDEGWEWGQAVSHECYLEAQKGSWDLLLTPTKKVPKNWFGQIQGQKILGLASGGGQQMPILTALGASCTVFDNSKRQLEQERLVAERENYQIEMIQGDMTKKLPFDDQTFDMIVHPVSNCYVESVEPIWKECFRVLKSNGRLLSGLDIGINYIVNDDETAIINGLPFNPLTNDQHYQQLMATDSGIQFSHTLEEQIGGQLRAGFSLAELYEDTNGQGRLHELNIPSYIATLCIKK